MKRSIVLAYSRLVQAFQLQHGLLLFVEDKCIYGPGESREGALFVTQNLINFLSQKRYIPGKTVNQSDAYAKASLAYSKKSFSYSTQIAFHLYNFKTGGFNLWISDREKEFMLTYLQLILKREKEKSDLYFQINRLEYD